MFLNVSKLKEFNQHAGAVYCLEKGRTEKTFFSGAADGFVAEWNLEKLEPEKFSIKLNSPVFCIKHIIEKKTLVIGLFNGHLHVVDLSTKQEIKHFELPSKGIYCLHYDPAQGFLYSGDGTGSIYVWDVTSWDLKLSIPLSTEKIRRIGQGRTGDEIAVCCGDGSIRFLETQFFNETHQLQVNSTGVNDCYLHGDFLYTAGKDAHLNLYRIDTLDLEQTIPAHNYGIYRILQHPLGLITASRDKTIKVWPNNALKTPLRIDFKGFKGHTHSVNDILISDWNKSLISCGDDKKIIVWNLSVD